MLFPVSAGVIWFWLLGDVERERDVFYAQEEVINSPGRTIPTECLRDLLVSSHAMSEDVGR